MLVPLGHTLSEKFGITHIINFTSLIVIIILLICFILGLMLRWSGINRFSRWLERNVFQFFPGYEYMKAMLQEQLSEEHDSGQQVIIVKLDDSWYPAVLVEPETNGMCTVFLPSAPQMNSGQVCVVEVQRVMKLNCGIKDLYQMQRGFGKGLAQKIAISVPGKEQETGNRAAED